MLKFVLIVVIFNPVLSQLNKIIDLTWDFSNETVYWLGVTPFEFTKTVGHNERGYWYAANEFRAGEHGGTHFDAPYHFNANGWKVDQVPVERLVAKGATIDLSQNSTKALERHHLENWVRQNGDFPENTVLLVKFGWSKHWPRRSNYFAVTPDGKFDFPGLSPEAASWIAETGKIVGVGLDTPSVDPGTSTDFQAHRILAKNMIYIMENVKILENLPPKGFTLVALPMKIKNGTGAPLRVLALPNNLNSE
ncbi:kynurenine formamidase-like [Tribolium madens]|uniref:kynurenine formamidase-like n=1 Tax=Tribolium madens TaxID=41895 RepID=UPI001CF75D62|nr:kynurenine formamidase-like [Tribolium madens]